MTSLSPYWQPFWAHVAGLLSCRGAFLEGRSSAGGVTGWLDVLWYLGKDSEESKGPLLPRTGGHFGPMLQGCYHAAGRFERAGAVRVAS